MWRNNFLLYAIEDNIEREKNELNVVLNESLNTINKGNGNKVSSVGIIVFHKMINNLQRDITFL
jgi:SRSO17 transposase